MNVSREIVIYQKDGDNQIDSFEINLSVEDLIDILNIDANDDLNIYKVYQVTYNQYLKLIQLVTELSKYHFDQNDIFYECYQI
ncbi:hypothetical protein MH928_02770 [Flavobacterium sp. WW92]|uniref:DUF7683 domain-containing protein n=1 Tax=unclassified Flavobacterium TaxID=196869 RepID=UPI00222417B8|nr:MULTISPECIES: hypothetical protein [unclassified Flavobacterium]WDO13633.1 hypothetical protein MH928_02770 [Flavobacterium sp. WW92]